MNSKLLLLFTIVGLIAISHSSYVFAEPGDKPEAEVPDVFAKKDHMTLDKQNYSDGDVVRMTGFIEDLREGHFLTTIMVPPSGEIRSVNHLHSASGYFGSGSRIVGSSWEDGIYKIIVSGAGKEFTEIFGVNYVLTESDITKHRQEEQEKTTGQQEEKLFKSHVGVYKDTKNYVQGGLVKIFGFVHLNEKDQVNPDEQVTLRIYGKNSKIVIHEAKVNLDEYNDFSYYLDTSDDTKWKYATKTTLPPFGTPRGFYYAVAEYAGLTEKTKFSLNATVKQDIDINGITEKVKTSQPDTEHTETGDLMQPASNDEDNKHPDSYLEWIKDSYSPTGTSVVVKVTDPNRNKDSKTVDSFNIRVYSGSVLGDPLLPVIETDTNTGIFEGTIFYSNTTDRSSSSNNIFVADGHTITVIYEGNTLMFRPNNISPADKSDTVEIPVTKNTTEFSPHKQQMTIGITSEHVTCNKGLEKVFRFNDSVVCVKPSSVDKLIQRGYITSIGAVTPYNDENGLLKHGQ